MISATTTTITLVTPEEKARQEIDRQLDACGWIVQDHKSMNIMAGQGVVVSEFPLKTGSVDCLFYLDGKVAGVIEAKPEGRTLRGVTSISSGSRTRASRILKTFPSRTF